MPTWHRVCALTDLPAPGVMPAKVGGRELVLCHTGGTVYALDDTCTHAEARMCEGRLKGTRLACPMHGASFDVTSGAVLSGPATRPLARHAVRISDGFVEVATS
jgi:nitrite reductase/ring-hydroxylating ferredoxin subunit